MMKKICVLFVLLSCVWGGNVWSQTAEEVIERSYKAAGIDQFDMKSQSLKMSMSLTAGGMTLPITSVMKYPDKMKAEMDMMGMPVEMIVHGNEGWILIPGQGVQPLPQEQLAQMRQQNNVFSNMKWEKSEYDFLLLDPVTKDGRQYDVVEFKVKEGVQIPFTVEKMVGYFDHETGLVAFIDMDIVEGGKSVSTKTVMDNYKEEDGVRYPSKMKVYMNGVEVTSIEITEFDLDYPTTDEMFAKPQ